MLSKLSYTDRLNPVNVCIVFGNFRHKWIFFVFWKKSQNCTDPKKKLMLGRWCSHKRSIPSPKIQLLSNILWNYSNFFVINQYDCPEYRKDFFIYVYIINIYTFEKKTQSPGTHVFVYLRSQPTRTCWKRLLKLVRLHAYKWDDSPWSGDCWLIRHKFFKFKTSYNLVVESLCQKMAAQPKIAHFHSFNGYPSLSVHKNHSICSIHQITCEIHLI